MEFFRLENVAENVTVCVDGNVELRRGLLIVRCFRALRVVEM